MTASLEMAKREEEQGYSGAKRLGVRSIDPAGIEA